MPVQISHILQIGVGGIGSDVVTLNQHEAIWKMVRRYLKLGQDPDRLARLIERFIPTINFDSSPPDQARRPPIFGDDPGIIKSWPATYRQMFAPGGALLLERKSTPPFEFCEAFLDDYSAMVMAKTGDSEAEGIPFNGRLNAMVNIRWIYEQILFSVKELMRLQGSDGWNELIQLGIPLTARPEIHVIIGGAGGQGTGAAVLILACLIHILHDLNLREQVKIRVVVLLPHYSNPSSTNEQRNRNCRALGLINDLAILKQGIAFELPFPDSPLEISLGMAQTVYDSLHVFEPLECENPGNAFLLRVVNTWTELYWGLLSGSSLRKAVESNAGKMGRIRFPHRSKAKLDSELSN